MNTGGGTQGTNPTPFDGNSYFYSGNIAQGFAEQTVDLVAKGFTPTQLDSLDFALVFGGPRIADVVVTKAATILVLGKDDFDTMIATHPRIEDKVMSTITQRIRVR